MNERLTDQITGATEEGLPVIPSSPAALFEPLAAPKEEPALTSASVPPTTPPAAPQAQQRRWPRFVAIGAAALLVGVGAGYFAGSPARNELTSQRDDARAEVAQLTEQLDTAKTDLTSTEALLASTNADLTAAQADLAASEESLSSMTGLRDAAATHASACETAATSANDLVVQWENLISDMNAWWDTPYGSAAEAEMTLHIQEQTQKMEEQSVAVERTMKTCLG